MTRFAAVVLILLAAGQAAAETRPGLTERIHCREAPRLSYALYVPAAYDSARKWPVLYVLDARGRALDALDVFREGADRHGYIIASSYDSASDGEMQPNIDAIREMWNDTHERLRIDNARAYAAGFSGTVRALVAIAMASRRSIRGIVGAAAGFPEGKRPARETPFIFFGSAGETDFNFDEMEWLDKDLAAAAVPYRIENFAGGHRWMPPEIATEALGWLTLRAMRDGSVAADPVKLESLWLEDIARVQRLEGSGRLVEAARLYRSMLADYDGLHDLNTIRSKSARLEASREFERLRAARESRLRRDRSFIARAVQLVASSLAPEAVISQLGIRELRRAADGTDEEANSARRRLNSIWVQTGVYLPRDFERRGDHARAARVLVIALAIDPDRPQTHYELARNYVLQRRTADAVASLREAARLGWSDATAFSNDRAFDAIRGHAEVRKIIESIASP